MSSERRSPPVLFVALLAAPVAAFLADSALAAALGWSPRASRLDLGVVALVGAFGLLATFAIALPATRRRIARRWPALAAAWLGGLAALALAELALGLAGDRIERAPFHGHPRGLRQVFEPKLEGTSQRARFSVNSLGLRGSEPPADPSVYRILCVGGSTTEDLYLDDEATWTRRLAEELSRRGGRRYWVASAGRSGFATVEHLRFLEQGSAVEEFDAVVVLPGINDLARLVWGERADQVAARAAGPPRPLWARSRILELGRRVSARFEPGNLVMDREALFVRDQRTQRSEARVMESDFEVEPALAAYRARLERIVAAVRGRGLALVLADQPTLFRAELSADEEKRLWFLRRSDGTYLPPRRMRELMDRFNAVTAEVARARAVPFVRLSAMDGVGEYYYDDCHFSEAGAAEVARRIALGVGWESLSARSRGPKPV